MGSPSCCDSTIPLKRGPWTPEEDRKLLAHIQEHGHGSWRFLPQKAGLQRCGKSCRLRWTNYLRPDIKRGKFSSHEEQTIIQLHALLGNRWSAIATHLPKRTDNEIKNYWNTHLKKRLAKMGIDPVTHKPSHAALTPTHGDSKKAANLNHMAQWESARVEAEARLAKESRFRHTQHHPSPSTRAPAQPLPKMASSSRLPAPPHLDVPTAWETRGAKPEKIGVPSPTSTLISFLENVPAISGVECSEITEILGSYGTEMEALGAQQCDINMTWSMESPDQENVNFVHLLFSRSGGGSSLPGDGGRDGEEVEDSKNYWNDIMNSVTCQPSHSLGL